MVDDMGQHFRCPYCGAHNKIGQRFCTNCRTRFYYSCTTCNSQIDPSYKFCPNCTTSMNWAVKPRVNILPKPAPEPMPRYKIALLSIAAVLLIGFTIWSYQSYRSSFASPLVFTGYESSGISLFESEKVVTAPPDSQYSASPPYNVKVGTAFNLTNNSGARNVTLSELKAFIYDDKTDSEVYMPGARMCGYFAQTVHNNAEKAGIKAAVAIVEFEGETILHAINAFQTSDKGLVYIDCTGTKKSPLGIDEWLLKLVYPRGQDRMAYLAGGKAYGTIPLEEAESPQYSFYSGYSKGLTTDEPFFFSGPSIVKSVQIYW